MAAGSTATSMLELRVRIPPGARMSVCSVFSAIDLYDVSILRVQQSYRKLCVCVCVCVCSGGCHYV